MHYMQLLTKKRNNYSGCFSFGKGSVYFTGDILATTDRVELLCRQSKIRSCGMT